jgi:predicted phosphoribosyltransferase
MIFADRAEAGRILASKLTNYRGRTDAVVLALPRGGIPVAYEIGRELGLPIDVFVVRKLGVPGQEELAMGAIATGSKDKIPTEEALNRLGKDGWELVGILNDSGSAYLYFKRVKA